MDFSTSPGYIIPFPPKISSLHCSCDWSALSHIWSKLDGNRVLLLFAGPGRICCDGIGASMWLLLRCTVLKTVRRLSQRLGFLPKSWSQWWFFPSGCQCVFIKVQSNTGNVGLPSTCLACVRPEVQSSTPQNKAKQRIVHVGVLYTPWSTS